MRLSDADILIIPGDAGLCDDHWQSRWLTKLSSASLIEPGRATREDIANWAARITSRAANADKPVVLVAHGSGITAAMHAVPDLPAEKVVGAFLVAAQDATGGADCAQDHAGGHGLDSGSTVQQAETAAALEMPMQQLPFPSILVASSNCPACTMERAKILAKAWGSTLVEAGESGSIDAKSGHGPWPEGLMRFGSFLQTIV